MLVSGGALLGAAVAAPTRGTGGAAQQRDGGTLRIAATTFDSVDPAISGFGWVDLATCALLVRYPDKPPPEGNRVVPELAAGYPSVSPDARRYTFRIRRGFRFSTGGRITGVNLAYAIDRVLSPTLHPEGGASIEDIVGASAVEAGRAKHAVGVKVSGNTLTIRLTKPVGDFLARLTSPYFCPVPTDLPIVPEGVNVPPPGSGPYYIAKWTRGRELVLRRNRFYRGGRPHRAAQFVVTIGDDPDTITRKIDANQTDWGCGFNFGCADVPTEAAGDLGKKYGVNRSRFFVRPEAAIFYLALNTERRLFRNNPLLRRAVNFALNRSALVRARGPYWGSPSDGYLPLGMPGAPTAHLYPLKRPNLAKARALARGHIRSGNAILYASDSDVSTAQAQIIRRSLKQIGIRVSIKQFPFPALIAKVGTRGEPFDIAQQGWAGNWFDPFWYINKLLDGRSIGKNGNYNVAYFDVPRYNRLMARAARLSGASRYRAYGTLAFGIARDAAPLAVFATRNTRLFVSKRVGCTILNGYDDGLDIAAACLK